MLINKKNGPYGYLCEVANPPFKFFVENATDEEGQPLVVETEISDGVKVFPIWRDERGEVLPMIVGYAYFDPDTRRRTFIDAADYDETVHTIENGWDAVTERCALTVNMSSKHQNAVVLHEKAFEAFGVWHYLPKDTPQDVRDRLKAIYYDKAKLAFDESHRLGFVNEPVPDDRREGYHREMADRHRQLARIYSY